MRWVFAGLGLAATLAIAAPATEPAEDMPAEMSEAAAHMLATQRAAQRSRSAEDR